MRVSNSNIQRLCAYLAVLFFFSNVASQMLFVYTMTTARTASTGRIYPLRVHYTVVYLAYMEHLLAGGWSCILAVLFGLGWMAMAQYRK